MDIEHKRTEEALRLSEEKYRALFDLYSQGFCICEMIVDENNHPVDYRFLEVNQLFEEHTGLKDATGRTAMEMLPTLEPYWVETYGKVALTGEPLRFEQGSEVMGRWFDVYAFRFGKPENRQFAIVFNDISDRRRAEVRGELLRILASSLSNSVSRQEITDIIVKRGFEGLGAAAGILALVSEDTDKIEIIGTTGNREREANTPVFIPLADLTSPIALAVREQKPLWMRTPEEYRQLIPTDSSITLEGAAQSWAVIPFNIDDDVVGAIRLTFNSSRKFDDSEQNFLITLTQYSAQALHRAKLTEQIGLMAVATERKRLSRDLHDSVKQLLFTSSTIAQALPRTIDGQPEKARRYAEDIYNLNLAALAELQSLLHEMRPEAIVMTPFMSLLNTLGDGLRGRRGVQVHVQYDGSSELILPPQTHIAFYRLAQEAINNILKHSEATQVDITCTYTSDHFRMVIQDNGKGFDIKRTSMGMGLNIMQERADTVGATLSISSAVGKGTTVTVEARL
ncbi:MAG: histidine kinase [Chloroflexi bacterium]|nr:histidine kinase [Chloroflexota bacterium]MCC6895953.1 GAF domain-containing protein [Anaerolineae bacterium]